MASMPVLDNPIAWVQVELRGGMGRLIRVAVVYGIALGILIAMSLRADPRSTQWSLSVWVKVILALQAAFLILLVCSTITKSVRRDLTTRMIESHRLAPISESRAVFGYIAGCAFQPICLAGVNVLLGAVVTLGAGERLHVWLLSNGILIWFAVSLWTGAVYYAMITQRGFEIALVLVVVGGLSGGITFAFVPAVILLIGPAVGGTMFGLPGSGGQWNSVYPVSMVAQAATAVLFYVAAARKYRRDNAIAFGPWIGLGLIAGWVVLSVLGVAHWPSLSPAFWGSTSIGAVEQSVASTLMAMILSLIPLSGTALLQEQYHRKKRLNDPSLGRKPVSVSLAALACAAVCLCLPLATMSVGPVTVARAVTVGVLVTSQLLVWAHLLRFLYRRATKPAPYMVVWICLTWLGPLFGELLRYALSGLQEWPGTIMVFSPIGTLLAILNNASLNTTAALVLQVALAVVMTVLTPLRGRLSSPPLR